jgi:t-SNARE complex subunit (syntaxin)
MKDDNIFKTSTAVAEFDALHMDIAMLVKTVANLTTVIEELQEFKKKAQSLFPSLADRKSL